MSDPTAFRETQAQGWDKAEYATPEASKIEMFEDGTGSFASARLDAWHQLGTVFDDVMTAEQALAAARLSNWNVRKEPLQTASGLVVPGAYATVRDNPDPKRKGQIDALGVVGSVYTPIQNEAHCELLNALVDESKGKIETAGSLKGGREVFVTMKLPETMTIGRDDELDLYIAALNSHDGHSPFRFLVTPVRVRCANTQRAAIKNADASFSIRHTRSASSKVAAAREALGLTFKYLDEFQAEADRMIAAELTDAQFRRIAADLWGAKKANENDDKGAQKRRWAHVDAVQSLFVDSSTIAPEIRNTKWAAYQAVTEYLDHYVTVPGSDFAARAERRALQGLTRSRSSQLKLRAFAKLSVPAPKSDKIVVPVKTKAAAK